jgi:hypothetical protein
LSRAAASWGYTLVPRFVIRSSTCDLNCSLAFCTCCFLGVVQLPLSVRDLVEVVLDRVQVGPDLVGRGGPDRQLLQLRDPRIDVLAGVADLVLGLLLLGLAAGSEPETEREG